MPDLKRALPICGRLSDSGTPIAFTSAHRSILDPDPEPALRLRDEFSIERRSAREDS